MEKKRKILIITYYWPPAGTVSVHRCLKIVKYLKQEGWTPIVYTALNAHYPYFDNSGFSDIPEGTEILRGKIIEPFSFFKFISGRKKTTPLNNILHVRDKKKSLIDKLAIRIRSNFFIPDARMLWIRPSVKLLSKYIQENKIDAILSTGPPHTSNYIAYKLKKKFNLPWIADFQDPWTQVDYYALLSLSKQGRAKHERMEQEVLKNSDINTIVSPSWKADLEKIGSERTEVIYLGYDPEDFPLETPKAYPEFTISHAGLLGFDRNPAVFFQVLKDLCTQDIEFKKNLRIKFAGSIDFSVRQEISKYGLDDNFEELGTISRTQALDLTMKSCILLLPLNISENVKGRVPGKLFEQMRSRIPILCLSPKGTDVEKILSQTEAGQTFEYDDYAGIRSFVEDLFKKYKSGKNVRTNGNIDKFSVVTQTKKLSGLIKTLTK